MWLLDRLEIWSWHHWQWLYFEVVEPVSFWYQLKRVKHD